MRFYLSHPIRGSKGDKATATDMKANCDTAIEIANYLRKNITPKVDIYVPAEHEDFVGEAYHMKYLTIEQILEIDCAIINNRDALLIYAPEGIIVAGCKVEMEHAIKNDIPVFVFADKETALKMVAGFIMRV